MAAVDDTRRRIERDLHDGLQQRLVALGLQLRAAEVSVPPAAAELKWELARVADGLMDVLQDCGRSPAGSTRRSSPSEAWSPP